GGEGGIRTPDTVTRMPHFECGAFNRSATSPGSRGRGKSPAPREYLAKGSKGDKRVREDRARMGASTSSVTATVQGWAAVHGFVNGWGGPGGPTVCAAARRAAARRECAALNPR